MPVQVTFPGVYVQEAPSGVNTIAEVATSVAAFIGMTPSGPVNVPTAVFSYREFDNIFGGDVYVGELADQVRQFFLNGGGQAWIVRNAQGALDGDTMVAKSSLRAEVVGVTSPSARVLVVSAKNAGTEGNSIQVAVDYNTSSPERTFNLTVLLPVVKSNGTTVFEPAEPTYTELTMDPASPRFAPFVVTRQSELINLAVHADIGGPTTVNPIDATANVSQSGLIFASIPNFVTNKLAGPGDRLFFISVANRPPVRVNLQGLPSATAAAVVGAIQQRINSALQDAGETVNVTVEILAAAGGDLVRILSDDGPVVITSAPNSDVAALLRLGVANGGLETDMYSARRPAANGFLSRVHSGSSPGTMFSRINGFAATAKDSVGNWVIDASPGHGGTAAVPEYTTAAKMGADASVDPSVAGTFTAVSAMLDALVNSINSTPAVSADFQAYRAGMRVGIRPTYGSADSDLGLKLTSPGGNAPIYTLEGGGNIAQNGARPTNVLRYPIGLPLPPVAPAPADAYRADVQPGNDGNAPLLDDYLYSWDKLERVADIFNIMVLPRAQGMAGRQTDIARAAIWPSASQFCRRLRAFLLVDPPTEDAPAAWLDVAAAVGDVANFRGPLDQDYAAVYWPRVITNDPAGKKIILDPSGTIAGLYAKTDTRRGIWKAPAGMEATLMGVTGLEVLVTNDENGRTNPQAINTLRMKVSGVTSWGARTLMGFEGAANQDYRYVPVRRTALLIEESLYRGLQFAVFEPNAEPLWGQIRLAAGSFMNGLFRKGAFKGLKASDAYYVACGPSTTTQRDINLGIVNVEVGFAPLKPAEFVVITIKQLAGQIEV